MKKKIFIIALTSLLLIQCAEEKDPYLISNNSVGELTIGMKIKQSGFYLCSGFYR